MSAASFINSIETIFSKNDELLQKAAGHRIKNRPIPTKELELALTVLLVELASCDQNFEPQEYNILQTGLRRLFGTSKDKVQALVNQATIVLRNLRGTSRFASQLKEHLDVKQREAIMDIVNDIIGVDGLEDGFEIYTRNKIAAILDVPAISAKSEV